jgi:hypothetical protein
MHGLINLKSPINTNKWQMGFNSGFKGLNNGTHYFINVGKFTVELGKVSKYCGYTTECATADSGFDSCQDRETFISCTAYRYSAGHNRHSFHWMQDVLSLMWQLLGREIWQLISSAKVRISCICTFIPPYCVHICLSHTIYQLKKLLYSVLSPRSYWSCLSNGVWLKWTVSLKCRKSVLPPLSGSMWCGWSCDQAKHNERKVPTNLQVGNLYHNRRQEYFVRLRLLKDDFRLTASWCL